MKGVLLILFFLSIGSAVLACDFVLESTGCDYGDTGHYDGNRWLAKNCTNGCRTIGHQHTTYCINTEGFCLPPDVKTAQDVQAILDAGNFCGPWFQDESNANMCLSGSQWSRQNECIFMTREFNQFKGCSEVGTPPPDHPAEF